MPDIYIPYVPNNVPGKSGPPEPTSTPIPPTQTPAPTATQTPTRTPSPTPSQTATPTATSTSTPPGQRLVIDPLTRVEGHLRIEAKVENGVITDAWSSSTMFRGLEMILQGRDPREAWLFAQRICGVCTTVHSIASVRAVENALGITPPDNARLIRNLIEAAQFIQDHVVHFYHLHATDWVDIVSAVSADPAATAALGQSTSDWPNNTVEHFTAVKTRLQGFVASGQLGLFANGYWGHNAYKLSPEANLLATSHYLEALDWQRQFIKIHAILGGKSPHPQSYLVGGVSIPVHPTSAAALNLTRLTQIRDLAVQAQAFVSKVYLPDLKLVASQYKEWGAIGGGGGNFLSFGDFPGTIDNSPANFFLPRGVIFNRQINVAPTAMDPALIQEYVTHSWYAYTGGDAAGKHPAAGQTQPNYTGPDFPYDYLNVDSKYSWLKTPRYQNQPMEVGPLARMLVAYAAGHARARQLIDQSLAQLAVPQSALFSSLGRTLARGLETLMIAEKMTVWVDELQANIQSGNLESHAGAKWNPTTWPASATGWGWTEAPRGALGHWLSIQNGKINHYQAVVPTTWNGSPRDAQGQRSPFEQALIGTPVADLNRPVEILRVIHSFDPCMACAVHLVDVEGRSLTRVEVI